MKQNNEMTRLGNAATTTHLYSLEVLNPLGKRNAIEVYANSRTQAASIAKRAGYSICSINMIG
jgi:hypothetical protein